MERSTRAQPEYPPPYTVSLWGLTSLFGTPTSIEKIKFPLALDSARLSAYRGGMSPEDLLTPEQRAELAKVREVMLAHPKELERDRPTPSPETPVPA